MQQRIQELEQQHANNEAAGMFMQNMVASGLVEQTGRDSIVVHSANGDKEFKLEGKN